MHFFYMPTTDRTIIYGLSNAGLRIGASLLDCPEKVSDIEEKKDVKIMAVNGKIISNGDDIINVTDNILCFSTLMQAKNISGIKGGIHTPSKPAKEWRCKEMFSSLIPSDSILTGTLLTLAAIVVCCIVFFHFSENLSIISSIYFVVTILTTVGFGDINLKDSSDIAKIIGIILMMSGTVLLGTLFAIFTNSMVKKRIELLMGHRKMKLRNHTIVCGLGDVGMRILENLLLINEQVVIIERNPDNRFIQNLRGMGVSYIIADAALEETLVNAAVEQAKAIICATDDDMNNLETGLNALGLNKDIRVVLRIFDKGFAEKIENNFAIHCAISSSYIAAPFFVSALDDTSVLHSINSGGKELFIAQGRIEDENLCKELIMKENIKPLMVVDENDIMTLFKDDLLKKGSRLFYVTDNPNN